MLVSSDYYPALQRDNCKLIDWPIATLSPVGIRTSDGIEHHLDCIVFATGYDVHLTGPPFPVTGLGGRVAEHRMGQWRTGLQERQRARVSEPVLHDRSQLRARAQFAAGLHRGPARLRRARYHHHPGQQLALSRRPQRRPTPLQRAHPAATHQDDMDVRLQQLVSDQGRIQRVDVPRVRHPVPSTDAETSGSPTTTRSLTRADARVSSSA